MEVNQSAGNMTGEDYLIALMYAYINDTINANSINDLSRPNSRAVQNEAISKFGHYSEIYTSNKLEIEFSGLMSHSMTRECYVEGGSTYCNGRYVMPEQGRIDLCLYCLFHNDTECKIAYPDSYSTGFSDDLNEARAAYQTRIVEEAELKAKQEKREADRLLKQQENEARQAALDARYKALFENATIELQKLENESNNIIDNASKEVKYLDAFRLLNNSSKELVSPYSNILLIYSGNILVKMSTLSDDHHKNIMYTATASQCYVNARENFTYSNESEDYQNAIHQDFIDHWNGIIEAKMGIAEDRLKEELYAMVTDLKDAPNAKQLLSGHINKKYDVMVMNYTEPMFTKAVEDSNHPYADRPGYWVQVNLSAYNDPESNEIDEYIIQNIPIFIDIFSSLFSDERISVAYIQLNETYYDRFGHTEERPVMKARLDNVTSTEIGDWSTFKKYVGKDMDRFKQAIDVKKWY